MCKHDDGCNTPAVKALRDAHFKQGVAKGVLEMSLAEKNRRIAALESQLAELRHGRKLPEGWIPLTISFDGAFPEDVAYGPEIMMNRLKKWLDKFYALRLSELRQGGEAVAEVCEMIGPDDSRTPHLVLRRHMPMPPTGTQLYTRPQPAIPPGYAVVPKFLTEKMAEAIRSAAENRRYQSWPANCWEDAIAAAPSVPVAEKDKNLKTVGDRLIEYLNRVQAPADSKEGEK